MSRKLKPGEEKDKFQCYMSKLMQLEFAKFLLENGLERRKSATVRALVSALIDKKINIEMLMPYIEKETLITMGGERRESKISKL